MLPSRSSSPKALFLPSLHPPLLTRVYTHVSFCSPPLFLCFYGAFSVLDFLSRTLLLLLCLSIRLFSRLRATRFEVPPRLPASRQAAWTTMESLMSPLAVSPLLPPMRLFSPNILVSPCDYFTGQPCSRPGPSTYLRVKSFFPTAHVFRLKPDRRRLFHFRV